MNEAQLILDLFDNNLIKFGEFTLKSGEITHIYSDMRTSISYPALFKTICDKLYSKMSNLNYDFICGVPYSALTFASAIAYSQNIPMLLKRKEAKDYGTKKILEGDFMPGQNCLIIEDVVTSGASILETIKLLEEKELKITDICILIDRNQGGKEHLESLGYKVHSVMNLKDIISVLFDAKRINQQNKEQALSSI